MSRPQGENVFKKRVVKELKETFGDSIDILGTQERARKGVADLVICLKGISIRNELKIDGEAPTKLQQLKLDRHSRAGGLSLSSTPNDWPDHLALLRERFGAKL
jgi:hypothetical protein